MKRYTRAERKQVERVEPLGLRPLTKEEAALRAPRTDAPQLHPPQLAYEDRDFEDPTERRIRAAERRLDRALALMSRARDQLVAAVRAHERLTGPQGTGSGSSKPKKSAARKPGRSKAAGATLSGPKKAKRR